MIRSKPRRAKVAEHNAVYHCMSRVVRGERFLGSKEREVMRRMLEKTARFCGVEIITFALMENHFHVLVLVPRFPDTPPSNEDLLRRCEALYGADLPRMRHIREVLRGGDTPAENLRRRLLARLYDVSNFMKEFKQRFSIWYNRNHEKGFGTFWSDRFKSTLIENCTEAVQTVAGYIDLNPVRAGLCRDPKDYRWCGYAEAVAGRTGARRGLNLVYGTPWGQTHPRYRLFLFEEGRCQRKPRGHAVVSRSAFFRVRKEGGCLSTAELVRQRCRYLIAGWVLGSRVFVEDWLAQSESLLGLKRKIHPQRVGQSGAVELVALKTLRRERSI